MGIARLLLVGVAILAVLGLVVVGVISLIGSLDSSGASPSPSASASSGGPSPSPSAQDSGRTVPTLFVECRADRCPIFVRATGGDVIEDRDLAQGQQAIYTQPALDVVLGDASTVYVEVNGKARSPGKPGERQSFTVKRAPEQ